MDNKKDTPCKCSNRGKIMNLTNNIDINNITSIEAINKLNEAKN